jgi:hypothetical protein
MEYIANIITPEGKFFPDVLRRISRVLGKIHKDQVDWNETKIAITDCLDVIQDDADLQVGSKIASRFYAQYNIHITPEEILYLISYLNTLKELENLEDITSETYTFLNIPSF